MKKKTLNFALRGQTGTGKTTFAAALVGSRSYPHFDPLDERARPTVRGLTEQWDKLYNNQLPQGTIQSQTYTLALADGTLVELNDIRGAHSSNPLTNPKEADAMIVADAVLVFLEWPTKGGDTAIQVSSIRTMLAQLKSLDHVVLVVTKAELGMTREELIAWERDRSVLKRVAQSCPKEFRQLLDDFPAWRTVPITVYGYDDNGRPAHYLDEFGRCVPLTPSPLHVGDLFGLCLAVADAYEEVAA